MTYIIETIGEENAWVPNKFTLLKWLYILACAPKPDTMPRCRPEFYRTTATPRIKPTCHHDKPYKDFSNASSSSFDIG